MKITTLLALAALVPASARAVTLHVRDVPKEGWTLQGPDDGRYEWSKSGGVVLDADSNEPSARLFAPLPFTLDGFQSWSAEIVLELENVDASPVDFFQISIALINTGTTGLNRTGTSLPGPPFFVDDADTFDSVELAYFPNVTPFGGPFLQPTIFGAAAGPSAFMNFAANFGPSSDLGDNTGAQVTSLPLSRPLRFVLRYDACAQRLLTTVEDLSKGGGMLDLGLEPLDVSPVIAAGTFVVDAVAVNAYHDYADSDPTTPSLLARTLVTFIAVEPLDGIDARLMPAAVNAGAHGSARVLVRGTAATSARLVEVAGAPVDVPLEARVTGDGLVVEIDRQVAAGSFVLDVGGCLVPLAPERISPR